MAEWVKTRGDAKEEWHRLTGDVPEPGKMLTACGMRIPDHESVERSSNPPEWLQHVPDREAPAPG